MKAQNSFAKLLRTCSFALEVKGHSKRPVVTSESYLFSLTFGAERGGDGETSTQQSLLYPIAVYYSYSYPRIQVQRPGTSER
jgi:hypothetical protein